MLNSDPYDADFRTADVRRRSEPGRGTLAFHLIGTFALLWSIVAWLEWFLIPILFPSNGGPVPHLAFAPQAILLLLGCVVTSLTMPIIALSARRWGTLLYAVPSVAYVAFQVWRVI
jgi:hypothetical protein